MVVPHVVVPMIDTLGSFVALNFGFVDIVQSNGSGISLGMS